MERKSGHPKVSEKEVGRNVGRDVGKNSEQDVREEVSFGKCLLIGLF